MEQNTDIVNEPREEIVDTDLAVGLAENGFHIYLDNTDRQLTFEKIYDYFDDYGRLKDGHTFTVPMMEVAQFGALETLCEKFESFNDEVRADGGLRGLSLEDYADELLDDEESHFEWRNGQSEWENVRRSILSGETKFLHNFLYDAAFDYPSRAAEIREDLNDYETTYFKEKQTDKTFAYAIGNSEPFTVVRLDIGSEERKNAVSEALKNIIYNAFGERNDMSQPYKNLLEQITPETEFVIAFEGHLSCLKYALRNAESDKELCISMLDSIKSVESSPEKTVIIKGYDCLPKDAWEEHGVKFTIGQSVDGDMSFYYARATDGKVTRDYEYDHKPDREKVMSDHADKLAEEDIDRGETIYGADGYLAFHDPEMKHLAENIPQKQDISHNFNHADPTAQRGERKDTMNTKFEVTSMTMLDGDNPKAIASVAINDELIVGGITVRANQEGELYVKMPQQKNGKDEQGKDKYEDRVFPTTAEARKALDEAVLGTFENLAAQGLQNSYVKVEPPENSVSKIGVSLNKTNSEKSNVKATGQITVDNCFVIKGVTVTENVNSKTKETFQSVNLPHFKQDKNGQYPPVVKPITAEMREKVNNAVMKSFNTQTRGVKFAEVGGKENSATYFRQNNQFAEKLMEQLENKGIPYHARISDTTTLSVKATDKAAVEDIKKEIANEGRKPSLLGEVGKIKAEQKAHEAEKPAPQKAKSNNQEL